MAEPVTVIVGAGPAGIRAAEVLARERLPVILLDEAPLCGGQIYRQPPEAFERAYQARYGFEARKARALHETLERIHGAIDYRPSTLVWNVWRQSVDTLCADRVERVAFDYLVLATGATDRVLPVAGWTLPGVYTLGGAQIALKHQGCAIGRRVALLGTGPLLYLVAYQYAKAGATIAAVLDTGAAPAKRRALRGLAISPRTLAKGLYYRAWLRARGVTIEEGILPLAIGGDIGVETVTYQRRGRTATLRCDAVGIGFGLKAETQLADLAGCAFAFDPGERQWLPERDADGRSSIDRVYLAGDGAALAGADAAELAGERAGRAIAARCGRARDAKRLAVIDRRFARLVRFRAAVERAFPFPAEHVRALRDDTILCRCEAVRIGAARAAMRDFTLTEMNRLKSIARIGMGRCQGRMCALAAAELLAAHTAQDVGAVGRLRAQPPVKPLPAAALGAP